MNNIISILPVSNISIIDQQYTLSCFSFSDALGYNNLTCVGTAQRSLTGRPLGDPMPIGRAMQDPALDNSSPLDASRVKRSHLSVAFHWQVWLRTLQNEDIGLRDLASSLSLPSKYYPIGLDSIAPQRMSTWSSDESHMLAHTIISLKIAGTLPF